MNSSSSVVWFRHDFRLADNPALVAATKRGRVLPLFIWVPEEEGAWPPGAASRWWLHQSLRQLDVSLRKLKSQLVIRRGPALEALQTFARECNADAVFWNRRYEPAIIERDRKIKETLRARGLTVESFNGALLHEPWSIQNKSGKPFQVFTPFWKNCVAREAPPAPLPAPTKISSPAKFPPSVTLASLELEPKINWADGFRAAWQPGEAGATKTLDRFCEKAFADYNTGRNRTDLAGTSRLSPYLHFGEISPRQIWHELARRAQKKHFSENAWRSSQYLTEIGWREFAHHLLFHFPNTPVRPLCPAFENFPWRENKVLLESWQRGRTGFPIVDAGMRELWTTGWMHNRVRMIVASFLTKDLLQPWQSGAQWFWDTLVDADLANNTLGWQWTAGCGADASPFFRIFNPTTQGEKFDPEGDYVRRWVPEIARLPAKWIHQPWLAPKDVLASAGVEIGRTYPKPIVDHGAAREAALAAYSKIQA